MAQLRQEVSKLEENDIEVLIIGPEKREKFREYWEKESMPFIGLPDPEHRVPQRYGQEIKFLKLGRMPAQMIIDTSGIIRAVHYANSMADIPDTTEFIKALEGK